VIVMPLTAFLGRLFGQKRVYMTALALFVAGSALCGMARSLPMMVLFRVIQGLGAGALQPTEQAILRQTFPPKEHGMAMAFFGMAVVLGPAFGPTLGGWIVDNYSWPWIFYINLPIGCLALFMVSRFVHEPEDIRRANQKAAAKQRDNLDWLGIALLALGLAMMQYVLEEGQRSDWFQSAVISTCAVVALFALAAFVIRELTAPVPAVDLSLFKDKVFLSGTLIGAVMFAMLISITFLLPVFMQELLGFDATLSGVALMPRSLIMIVAMPVVGKIYNKVSPRLVVAFGIILFAVTAWQMSHYTIDTNAFGIIGTLTLQGIAFACLFIPLTTVALATIPRYKLADASGLYGLFRQVGGSLGLAAFASYIPSFAQVARTGLVAHLNPGRPEVMARIAGAAAGLRAHGYDAVSAHTAAPRVLAFLIGRESMVMTFEKLFLLSGILFLAVLPLLWFLKAPTEGEMNAAAAHIEM
jgi:DHA2 family multidrug resistance protein